MAATWKTVRVFISSTFRDMHAERDWLVKRVFPALRERLEKYRIHLVDIDLRWGITEEEAQKDQVLDLCLSQIDECRPFFIGILGERYGWVPSSFSGEAASKYGWVQYQTGKSVTELEILYGVLHDPEMHGHGMFFFRDPAFVADVPEAKRADLVAEDQESAEKLAALKQTIRDAHLPFPPFEDYPCRYAGLRINWRVASRELESETDRETLRKVAESGIVAPQDYQRLPSHARDVVHRLGVVHLTDLEEFGQRVSEQLWQAIQREHALPETPPVVTLAETDPLAEEAAYHEEFIESRVRVYVGRENVQEQLTAFADGDATCPCLVTARAGSGKSAALARFARSYAEAHPDVLVIPHFVGASPGSTSLRQMLRRFCLVLQDRFGLTEEVPQDINELVGRFRQSLASAPADARVVVVLDALNQLDEGDQAHSMYWLPWELPPHVKVIVSCIEECGPVSPSPDRARIADVPPRGSVAGEQSRRHTPCAETDGTRSVPTTSPTEPVLQALAHRPLERLAIQPLTDDERLEIVRRVPTLSAKKLDPKQIALLVKNPATKNPLFLLVALEELRGFGSYEQVAARIAAFPSEGDTVVALFGQVIERLREEFDPDALLLVLGPLGCSRHGMSPRELLEMVEGIGVEESTSDLFAILRQLRPYLQHRGPLVDFFHRGFYKAVRQRYLPDDDSVRSWHIELANYFRAKLNPSGAAPWSGQYARSLSELPYHQTQGQLWGPLETALTALPFLEAKVQAGMAFELAGDFSAGVEALPADRPQHRILRLLEEALRRDIHFIARHAQDYPQALFQCLWNSCWWYDCPQAAAHYVEGRAPSVIGSRRAPTSPAAEPTNSALGAGLPTPPRPPTEGLPSRDDASSAPALHALLERWREAKEHAAPNFPWLRTHRPPPVHLGTAQKAVLPGHEWPVTSVSYSPDGARIASGSRDNTVRVWDARSGAELAVLRGHEEMVASVSYSPDGARIASGSDDNTVRVWDARSGAELAVLRGHENHVTSVSHSPDGSQIASGSWDNTVRVWDARSGAELAALRGHEGWVTSVSYSPDGARIASGSDDKTVRVWDARSGAELAVLRGHEREVESVSYSPDGARIASGSGASYGHMDNTVRVWDARSGAELAVLRGHESQVTSVSYSPDGARIASGSEDNTVRVWNACSGAGLAALRGHEGEVRSVSYSPDGARIASGSDDKTVRVWDACSGAELAALRGHEGWVTSVSYSPDGARIASGSWDKTVRVWDARSGAELAVLRGHENSVRSVSYSPDGARIASGSSDQAVRVWDARSGAELEVIQGSGDVRAIAAGSQAFPLQALDRGPETVVERADSGELVAWFPVCLNKIVTHPSGRTWAGAAANYLCLITLEGGDFPT